MHTSATSEYIYTATLRSLFFLVTNNKWDEMCDSCCLCETLLCFPTQYKDLLGYSFYLAISLAIMTADSS